MPRTPLFSVAGAAYITRYGLDRRSNKIKSTTQPMPHDPPVQRYKTPTGMSAS